MWKENKTFFTQSILGELGAEKTTPGRNTNKRRE
jgi:hypothetical protein